MIDVDPNTARRIEQHALRVLQRQQRIARGEKWPLVVNLYDRFLMPAGAAAVVSAELVYVAKIAFAW